MKNIGWNLDQESLRLFGRRNMNAAGLRVEKIERLGGGSWRDACPYQESQNNATIADSQ